MEILKKILKFIIHFFRRILFFATAIVVNLSCQIIFLITIEPKVGKMVTKRKMKRIKFFTKFKLYCWKYGWWYFEFIHYGNEYLKELYDKFNYLIEKEK